MALITVDYDLPNGVKDSSLDMIKINLKIHIDDFKIHINTIYKNIMFFHDSCDIIIDEDNNLFDIWFHIYNNKVRCRISNKSDGIYISKCGSDINDEGRRELLDKLNNIITKIETKYRIYTGGDCYCGNHY